MMSASGYLGAIAAKGPVSFTVPSMITTAPAGMTPDAPRRGSVMAYAPRMMIVLVITLHPSQFGTPEPTPPSNTAHDGSRCRAIGEIVHLYRSSAQIHSVDAARRPPHAFPEKAGIHFCRGHRLSPV